MKKYALLISFFLTLSANAKLFLEPYMGFGKATSEQISNPSVTFDSFSINPGLKVGMATMLRLVSAGIEISYQDSMVENPREELNLERMDYALFAGFDFPVLFRVFGKYILQSNLDIGNTEIVNPSGYGLGLGYTGLPFLSLNLEYRNLSWNKIRTNDFEANNDGEISEVILSLSLPLKF